MSDKRLSREEIANLEIGHTDLGRGTAWALAGVFLAVIVAVPLVQIAIDARTGDGQMLDVLRIPQQAAGRFANEPGSTTHRLMAANKEALERIDRFETDLKDNSFLKKSLVTPMQAFNTRFLGQGNDLAFVGRDGWLFFRPGVEYVTGPGFLEPDRLLRRRRGGNSWETPPHPDPRPAILEMHEYLKEQGVALVLVPAPVKAMVHPEGLSGRYAADDEALNNTSYESLEHELSVKHGIPTINFWTKLKALERDAFLRTDTHWTPEAMAVYAREIAGFLGTTPGLSGGHSWDTRDVVVTNLGDIAANTLQLADAGLFRPEVVTNRALIDPPDLGRDAEVILLGDSFANIYSENTGLNWGSDAGLPHQLARELGQPVMAFTQNNNGAHATREMLYRHALSKGRDFWKNKKVVVWEFAIRELAVGDWKPIPWDTIPDRAGSNAVAAAAGSTLTGTIRRLSRPPKPGTVPYRECIVELFLDELEGTGGEVALVRTFGMKSNVWTSATKYEVGQRVTLPVEPWEDAKRAKKLGTLTLQAADLTVDELLASPPEFWSDL